MANSTSTKKQTNTTITGTIRTMQDDISASKPEPFQLRHRRPLPKSNTMEDFQTKQTRKPEIPLFHHPNTSNGPVTLPREKKQPSTSNPVTWIAMAVLSIIFLAILTTLILTTI